MRLPWSAHVVRLSSVTRYGLSVMLRLFPCSMLRTLVFHSSLPLPRFVIYADISQSTHGCSKRYSTTLSFEFNLTPTPGSHSTSLLRCMTVDRPFVNGS